MSDNDIVVVGSINMDLVIKSKKIPNEGETILGDDFSKFFGGKGANQVVATRKLNSNSAFIGAVGEDNYGEILTDNLNSQGIKTYIKKTNTSSGIANILVTEGGENRIILIPGANNELSQKFIKKNKEIISKSEILLVQQEIPIKTVKKAIEIAYENDLTIILDPAPVKKFNINLLNKIDYLLPNEYELNQLLKLIFPKKNSNNIKTLLETGVKNIVVTKGKNGATLYNKNYKLNISGRGVNVLDTTGAGDAFSGAFAVGLLKNWEIKKVLQFAVYYSSLSVTKNGAQNSFYDAEDLEEFIL